MFLARGKRRDGAPITLHVWPSKIAYDGEPFNAPSHVLFNATTCVPLTSLYKSDAGILKTRTVIYRATDGAAAPAVGPDDELVLLELTPAEAETEPRPHVPKLPWSTVAVTCPKAGRRPTNKSMRVIETAVALYPKPCIGSGRRSAFKAPATTMTKQQAYSRLPGSSGPLVAVGSPGSRSPRESGRTSLP